MSFWQDEWHSVFILLISTWLFSCRLDCWVSSRNCIFILYALSVRICTESYRVREYVSAYARIAGLSIIAGSSSPLWYWGLQYCCKQHIQISLEVNKILTQFQLYFNWELVNHSGQIISIRCASDSHTGARRIQDKMVNSRVYEFRQSSKRLWITNYFLGTHFYFRLLIGPPATRYFS